MNLIRDAMNLQDDKATTLVNFIQTKLTSDDDLDQSVLKVGLYDVVIPAGQVRLVKCKVPSTFDTSKSPVLFEPSENNPQLQQLDVGDSLIEVCHEKAPYVKVPIGNHTKHDMTLFSRSVLGSLESVVKVVQTNELDPAAPGVAQVANSDEPPQNSARRVW